jgi:uncharacterized membrane protein
VVAVAAAGWLIAANLLLAPFTGMALFCVPGSDCGTVHASRYAAFLGLPTSAWGAALYAAVGGLGLLGLPARRWLAAFVLSVVGLSAATYLAYLALFVLGAACVYCFVSAAIAGTLLAVVLAGRPAATAHRPLLSAGSLAGLGGLTALGTVAIVATAFGVNGLS